MDLILDTSVLVDAERGRATLAELVGDDEPVAHARLLAEVQRSGRPRGAHDLIIAATAAATTRTVVTADLQGFADLTGVRIRGGTPDTP